jgi:hypothetical protein
MIIPAGMGVSSPAHFESRDLRAVNDGNQLLSLLDRVSFARHQSTKKSQNLMTSANSPKKIANNII